MDNNLQDIFGEEHNMRVNIRLQSVKQASDTTEFWKSLVSDEGVSNRGELGNVNSAPLQDWIPA